MSGATRTIDAHVHLWNRAVGRHEWIPRGGPLDRDFSAAEVRLELDFAGIDAAILVQAEDSLADTWFLLGVARDHDWIAGVVGWIPLDHPEAARAALDALVGEPALRGIRHLVHDDPRDDFLDLPEVRASLREVASRGLAFDVPDAWPRHLDAAARVARAIPELTVVIDHLAKPPVGGPDFDAWRRALGQVAAVPNTIAKFSGLHLPGAPFGLETVRPLWETALDAFGPDRLMYGGDWPMSVPDGGYQATWEVMRECLSELGETERSAVLGGTAESVYRSQIVRPLWPQRHETDSIVADYPLNIR
ncbi:amidohydrolase family protein [Agromyces albus]|uniref:Hydrolase n=1 Tax=Agromyces albus TaxID=205332 RepID=A0A4Q2KVB8_9MICO|nr:amidohydrolase family protein [Agromyces albus]RXZ68849.1 hydrolase [Agromyces albus]